MKAYLAGPMTGIPAFNFPAFDEAAENLRVNGHYEVVSPAELDDPDHRAMVVASPDGLDFEDIDRANGKTWGDFLARDIKLIADGHFDLIIVLPGWQDSRGACLETFVGALIGLPVRAYDPSGTTTVSPITLLYAWQRKLWGR